MATYVTLINFTDRGVLHVKDTAKGQYNVVSIVDAPDEASMIALHVDSEGRPIMPSSEMEKAVERAKNVDGSKEGLSPAELYADGPMS
jgi:uncharacterized protein with GYD domain